MLRVEWYASVGELIQGLMKNAFSGVDYRVRVVLGATGRNIAGPPPRPLPVIELEVAGDDVYAIGVLERTT